LTVVLLIAGVGMFAYPVVTDYWAHQRQLQLEKQFHSPGFEQAYLNRDIKIGEGLTELQIPSLKVDVLVVQGTTLSALRAGAGHYIETPLPGQQGNVGIAGHRTTYGRPFNHLDEMTPGQTVLLITPFAKYTYAVVPAFDGHANPWVVLPDDYSVVAQTGNLGTGHWLTLTTCTPKGSASHRLILRLRLVATASLVPGASVSP
jgi:sortase A